MKDTIFPWICIIEIRFLKRVLTAICDMLAYTVYYMYDLQKNL